MITRRLLLLIAPTALLFGCQTPASTVAFTANAVTYRCDDGRTVQAVYPDTDSAVITFDGNTHRVHVVVSGSGARYSGDQWQWWTKGMRVARLAPLKSGETIASANGTRCHAP